MSIMDQIEYLNYIMKNPNFFIEDKELLLYANINNLKKLKLSSDEFWTLFKDFDKIKFIKRCEYLFKTFGTTLRCNRFDIGNTIEFCISDLLSENGLKNETKPNDSRIDISIFNYNDISIKFSKKGNIKLHNSLGINRDMIMRESIIITPNNIFLVSDELLRKYNLDLKKYLQSTGDGLCLRSKLLTELKKIKYKYMCDISINMFINKCEHKMCSELIYEKVKDIIP